MTCSLFPTAAVAVAVTVAVAVAYRFDDMSSECQSVSELVKYILYKGYPTLGLARGMRFYEMA